MNNLTACLLSAIVLCLSVQAQDLSGTILSREKKSTSTTILPGATIRWLGSTVGAISKKDGSYTIKRSESDRLIVSFVGYKTDTLLVASATKKLDVVLEADITLAEVSVQASTLSISNATIKTESISKHQLERSACCSLAESFEKSPSVEVTFSDAATGAKQIQLLGLRGVYTLTMTDAIPMIRGLATPFGLDYVPGSFIESICISKGAGSVLNGYEGITGQINIEYKRPQEELPLFINAYGNSNGRAELNVTSAQTLSPSWTSLVMLHGGWMQHERDANSDGFNDMPLYKNFNGMVRIFRDADDGTEFQLMAKMIIDDIRSGTTEHGIQEHTEHAFDISTKANRFEFYSKFSLNPLVGQPETRMGLQLAGSRHNTQTLIGNRVYNGVEDMIYSKLMLMTDIFEGLNCSYGFSFLYNNFDENFDPINPRDSISYYKRHEIVPGIFTELTYKPVDELVMVLGIRYDKHNLYGGFTTPRFHIKYDLSEDISLRLSAGTGTRVANALGDNISSLVNQRNIFIAQNLNPERALNYGASTSISFTLFDQKFNLDAEFFRTEFSNQVVVDMDRSPTSLFIGNLNGSSYSNSALAQLQFSPIERFDLSMSYRLIDARATTGGILQSRPLISPHRVLLSAGYSLPKQIWQIDFTLIWNGPGRIPSTAGNPDSFRMSDKFDSYFRASAQVTRRFTSIDLYAGIENATNFIQQNAVISTLDPHNNYFDASLIWGPLDARMVYAGLRWRFTED